MTISPDSAAISRLAADVLSSDALGRSRKLEALFRFLVECAEQGHAPKEVEIAGKVFGLSAGGGEGDTTVRAHVHRLRGKLEDHFAGRGGARLAIPKGGYRVVVESAPVAGEAPIAPVEVDHARRNILLGVLGGVVIGAGGTALLRGSRADPPDAQLAALRATAPWSRLLDRAHGVTLVVGDYFVFGETAADGRVHRVMRDFAINSPAEFEAWKVQHPAEASRFRNIEQSYLALGAAEALRIVAPIARAGPSGSGDGGVLTASRLSPAVLKQSNMVYLGNIRGLGLLRTPMFEGSRFRFDAAARRIVDSGSGQSFAAPSQIEDSSATLAGGYAIIALFRGPADTWVLALAGSRNAATVQAAEFLASPNSLAALATKIPLDQPFEALLAVDGLAGAGLRARIVSAYARRADQGWSDGG